MDSVSIFNEKKWRLKFCRDTGHSMECVEETIDKMLELMAKVAEIHNIGLDDAIENVYNITKDVEKFEASLLKLLSVKGCKCESRRTH